jgi:hypothetical protein
MWDAFSHSFSQDMFAPPTALATIGVAATLIVHEGIQAHELLVLPCILANTIFAPNLDHLQSVTHA